MATQVQWRGGSTAEHATFTGAAREVTVDTQKQTLVVHDGSTVGGRPLLREDGSNAALSLGSAGTPSLKFTGDTNTGIYSPGADQVAVATNGTGRLFVSDNGVATGGAPQSGYGALQVRNSFIYLNEDGADTTQMYLRTVSNEAAIQVATNHPFKIQTNNQERLRITSAGLVGIGTSSPQQLLHVHNSSAADARLKISNGATGSTQFDGLEFNCASTGLAGIIQWEQQPLYFYTNDGSAVDPRLAITAAGNVGIGTTAAPAKLTVSTSSFDPSTGFNDWSDGFFAVSPGGTSISGGVGIAYDTSANVGSIVAALPSNSWRPLKYIAGDHRFEIGGSEKARLDSSGRLLVGTSTGPSDSTLVLQGNSSNATFNSVLRMLRDVTNPAADTALGSIIYGVGSAASAGIECYADAQWAANDYPGRLVFSTTADGASSPTERMRISQNGQVQVSNALDSFLILSTASAGTSNYLLAGNNNAATAIIIYSNGNIQNINNSYGAISDLKLKENIVDASSQWDDLKALQVRNYNFKEGQTHTQIGLVAQEVELVSPGLVTESPDRDEDGNDLGTVTKSVNYSVLYMKAVKALQEAIAKIETLEGMVAVNNITIDEQQHQLSTLEARLTALESA
jgi:hypothetical protein